MLTTDHIDRFIDNPSEYFEYSQTKMLGVPRETLSQLQLGGLRRRFEQFRGKLPMMDKLADVQGIHAIDAIDDVLPLLFDHATYKSYPVSLLQKRRYAQLTSWLNKLTTHDLSHIDVSGCRSIDDWLLTLFRETPLTVVHTSGTTGTMSFIPWAKEDWRKTIMQFPVCYFQEFGKEPAPVRFPFNIDCIYPYFRSGSLSHTALNEAVVELIAGGEERFHAAYPGRLSADLMLLAAKRRAAAAKGHLDHLEIDPELEARHEEFAAQQRDMPAHVASFFSALSNKLAGRRIFTVLTAHMLHGLSQNGLQQGLSKVFTPDSVVITGGGAKGNVLPDDWQDTVKKFFGVDRLHVCYGMSEMAGNFPSCEHGNYHALPWIVPFVLDPDTGRPLPRKGAVTGRFAFYDLIPNARWGGFVTGDEVTMEWDAPCACGRATPYLVGTIRRLSERKNEDGEEKLSCAAAPDAYAEALDFLNEGMA